MVSMTRPPQLYSLLLYFLFLLAAQGTPKESVTESHLIWPKPVSYQGRAGSFVAIGRQIFGRANKGLWPAATAMKSTNTGGSLSDESYELLSAAVDRFNQDVKGGFGFTSREASHESSDGGERVNWTLEAVDVWVRTDERTLSPSTDESYEISVAESAQPTIVARTVFGAMRGLNTFYQLIEECPDEEVTRFCIRNVPLLIADQPRFPWRGLLVDTSRHFYSVPFLEHVIDSLAFNKMNVLHWHLSDAHSFPVNIKSYPNLSAFGAYDPAHAAYSVEDIQHLVDYGYQRGVRIVMEVDVPGHTASWGYGYRNLTVVCPQSTELNSVALDISNPFTHQVARAVIRALTATSRDSFFHLGGDEIDDKCWSLSNPFSQWMSASGFDFSEQAVSDFHQKLFMLLKEQGKQPVLWEEAYHSFLVSDNPAPHFFNVTFQVWKSHEKLFEIILGNRHTLFSYGWYLDRQHPLTHRSHYSYLETWEGMYSHEPLDYSLVNPSFRKLLAQKEHLLLGGEAAMWSETVDEMNFDSVVWPRAAAVAERLWSTKATTNVADAKRRLSTHRCRMVQHGIRAGPVREGHCTVHLKLPHTIELPNHGLKFQCPRPEYEDQQEHTQANAADITAGVLGVLLVFSNIWWAIRQQRLQNEVRKQQ